MPVAQLTLEIRIEHAQSLKDRRQVVRSLKDQIRQGFNVSVAEMDEAVTWQSATIGVVAISRSRDYLHGLVEEVERAARRIINDHGANCPIHSGNTWRAETGSFVCTASGPRKGFRGPDAANTDALVHRDQDVVVDAQAGLNGLHGTPAGFLLRLGDGQESLLEEFA